MATKKGEPKAANPALSPRIIVGMLAVAVIASVSSFIAIRLALPKQIIVEQRTIVEHEKGTHEATKSSELWTLTEPFIVNLSDPKRRFLKTTVTLRLSKPAPPPGEHGEEGGGGGHGAPAKGPSPFIQSLAPYQPVFRDTIIRTLRKQTTITLQDPDRVKSEMKVALNLMRRDDEEIPETLEVYFGEFVVQ
ncbi:MAG: flagellar basal body-associated FliL family protein [Candidatus Sericytochromatia bacterium]|nr:flagellar basal body-associated FliL family protein [Candidatus Sericytochromatia bacterium]